MGGNLNQENIFTRTSYVCAFAVVSTKSLIQQNVKAEIWFSHPNTSTRILVYVAASLTLLSRPRNMSFYKCMLNEKLDFEIVYRKFRVGRGEGSEGMMRGVCVFCLLWNSRLNWKLLCFEVMWTLTVMWKLFVKQRNEEIREDPKRGYFVDTQLVTVTCWP